MSDFNAAATPAAGRLDIRKYPNRRFYDATRSRHVTLADLHDLICAGHELVITDSATGEDITRTVLTQIILERDPLKLSLFPPAMLHQLIRTQQQFLGGVLEQFFMQFLQTQRASQERWSRLLADMFGSPFAAGTPMDWARRLWPQPSESPAAPAAASGETGRGGAENAASEISELRAEVARLAETLRSVSERGAKG